MDLGVHLPLMSFRDEALSLRRLAEAVDAARDCEFAAISVNDHFVFSTPWLDGPTALASVIDRSGDMTLATTVTLPVLRGPVLLAKALAAIDVLSEGRLIAALGPGSSSRDYDLLGIPFDERWKRFDEAIPTLRALLNRDDRRLDANYYALPAGVELAPAPHRVRGIPLWIGSWGSRAGLRRVAGAGDGWLASAYNTTPERGLSQRPRHDVDVGIREPSRGRSGCRRGPRAGAGPRTRRLARSGLCRTRGAVRGPSLPIRGIGVRARLPLAVGRRKAAARARGRRGGSPDHAGLIRVVARAPEVRARPPSRRARRSSWRSPASDGSARAVRQRSGVRAVAGGW
jgi:Luciferase-like monooxygenase